MKLCLALSFFILFITSCDQEECQFNFDQMKSVEISELSNNLNLCLKSTDKEFIINNEPNLIQVFGTSCDSLLNIDFDQFTMIGFRTTRSGCNISFTRKLILNESNYTYYVLVETSGSCKVEGFSYNWAIIPKVGEPTLIAFEEIHCQQ
jgi:hypothetical protein